MDKKLDVSQWTHVRIVPTPPIKTQRHAVFALPQRVRTTIPRHPTASKSLTQPIRTTRIRALYSVGAAAHNLSGALGVAGDILVDDAAADVGCI